MECIDFDQDHDYPPIAPIIDRSWACLSKSASLPLACLYPCPIVTPSCSLSCIEKPKKVCRVDSPWFPLGPPPGESTVGSSGVDLNHGWRSGFPYSPGIQAFYGMYGIQQRTQRTQRMEYTNRVLR